jgi:tRNA pseudouridine55 synthase
MDGLLKINKPGGMTSHDVVQRLRRITKQKKIGHTGTLDPMAIGLLTLVLGRATRLVPFFEGWDKSYRFTVRFGITTDSHDQDGTELSRTEVTLTRADVEQTLAGFIGPLEQVPPMYSAIKVEGEALYKKARRGETLDLPPRNVEVYSAEVVSFDSPDAVIDLHCSKGFYVRALARDLGEALGCGGTVWTLQRTAMGPLTLDGALELEDLTREMAEENLLGMDAGLMDRPEARLTRDGAYRVAHGQQILSTAITDRTDNRVPGTVIRLYSEEGRFLGVGESAGSAINPRKVLV